MYPHQNFTRIPKLCSNRPESTCSKNYSPKTANSPAEYLPSTCEYPPKFMEFKRSLEMSQSLIHGPAPVATGAGPSIRDSIYLLVAQVIKYDNLRFSRSVSSGERSLAHAWHPLGRSPHLIPRPDPCPEPSAKGACQSSPAGPRAQHVARGHGSAKPYAF